MYFISAAVILLASLVLMVQVSLPYNKTGRASVLYNFNHIIVTHIYIYMCVCVCVCTHMYIYIYI